MGRSTGPSEIKRAGELLLGHQRTSGSNLVATATSPFPKINTSEIGVISFLFQRDLVTFKGLLRTKHWTISVSDMVLSQKHRT